jgi:hypothetical protein
MDLEPDTAFRRQIAENIHLNLLSADMQEPAQINGSFIRCLRMLIAPPDESEKSRIIRTTVRTTLYVLHQVHQYLVISSGRAESASPLLRQLGEFPSHEREGCDEAAFSSPLPIS